MLLPISKLLCCTSTCQLTLAIGSHHKRILSRWLSGVVVRTLDLRPSRRGFESRSWHCLVISERWQYYKSKLSWHITTTQVNSALHPSGIAKLSTSFGWGKGRKVTTAGWQVTLCDPIWHVISSSGVVISITNCYICVYFTLLYCNLNLIIQTIWGLPAEKHRIFFSFIFANPVEIHSILWCIFWPTV